VDAVAVFQTKMRGISISRRALRLRQPGRCVFQFTLSASEVLQIADITRAARGDGARLIGYQRAGVRTHVREITEYLEGEDVLFPNALILALPSTVKFTRSRGPRVSDGLAEAGTLEIPLPKERRPAWIVDGQQRALALSNSSNADLPVPITAFIADDLDLQRDQFVRINNTRALPPGLVTELLPGIVAPLPERLAARKVPSALCDALGNAPGSPLHGLIRRPSTPRNQFRSAVITDTAIVDMVQARLSTGCLLRYRNLATDDIDVVSVWTILVSYWGAVKTVFPDAWGLPPTESRLMHGVGIKALGRLMDDVMHGANAQSDDLQRQACERLALIEGRCHWTSGVWEEIDMRWDALENTARHAKLLSNQLVRLYAEAASG
jgi:DGQHR domain-containing protein